VIARRTEKHLALAAEKRAERWRRIAHEAAQQARRSDVPIIFDPAPLAARVRAASEATRIVLAEQERTTTLRNALDEAVTAAEEEMPTLEIAVGPEGGWAPEEEALFDANGWRAAWLRTWSERPEIYTARFFCDALYMSTTRLRASRG
jgi:16S rRNA (uracil1498-N3)-methyltransferase